MLNTTINFRKLTDVRHDHGLSISELSMMTGLTEEQIDELENGKKGNSFVEHGHRIDCVKRVAAALGANYDQFLSSSEYSFLNQDISGLTKNEEKLEEESQLNEFNELKKEIARFRIQQLSGAGYCEDDRMEEGKKVNDQITKSAIYFVL